MTIGEWLQARRPAAPPALAARVREVLGASVHESATQAADRCAAAAGRVLADLLEHAGGGRECALDLLTADALVTYAFEAASDDAVSLDDRARRAMLDVARLAATAP